MGVKNNAGSKASLGTLSGEPHVGASERSHTWGKGPDSKGPCFSVSPGDTGKLSTSRVLRLGWGEWHYDAVILTWPQEGRRS